MGRDRRILIFIALLLGVAILAWLNREDGDAERLRGGGRDGEAPLARREQRAGESRPVVAEDGGPGDSIAQDPDGVASAPADDPGPPGEPGTISGRVVDAAGRPVGDASIELELLEIRTRPGDDPPPTGSLLRKTSSDAEGHFRFEDIPARARALLDAAGPKRESWGQAETWTGTRVTLRLFSGAVIEGLVRDEAGRTIRGLLVTSVQLEDEAALKADDFFNGALVARSDEVGRFVLRGLPPGELRLGSRNEDWWIESEVIEIREYERLQIDLVARPALAIAGHVRRNGTPMRMADVMAVPESGSWREGMSGGTAQTDDEGRFEIRGLRPGRFTITIQSGIGPLEQIARDRSGERPPVASPRPFKLKGVASGTRDLVIDLDN